jgi:hypothetical protein
MDVVREGAVHRPMDGSYATDRKTLERVIVSDMAKQGEYLDKQDDNRPVPAVALCLALALVLLEYG